MALRSRRYLAAFLPAPAFLLFVACGGIYDPGVAIPDADVEPLDAQADRVITLETSTVDSFVPTDASDASVDTGVDATPTDGPFAKLTLVNAATDLGPNAAIGASAAFRLCFAQGVTQANLSVAPYPPLPDKRPAGQVDPAGIYHGAGRTLPGFGLDLENRFLVPIVMNAATLLAKGVVNPGNGGPGITCDELVGAAANAANGMVANVDYWELPVIPAGTFKKQRSYVLALVGCVGDATVASTNKCGAGFVAGGGPSTGNLAVKIFETTRTPVSAPSLGVQFLQASAQSSAVLGALAFKPGFVLDPTSSAGFKLAVPATGVATWSISPVQAVAGVTDSHYFALAQTDPVTPSQPLLPSSLPLIQAGSGLGAAAPPTVYTAGKNFVFIAVGDPELASAEPKSFRFLAFATDPAVLPYAP
jgi:hypothetical protein